MSSRLEVRGLTGSPDPTGRRVAAIVLAAGTASRFGATKVLATLEGKPLLQHVLDTLAGAELREVVVVLGAAADEVERSIEWRQERRVRNPAPDRGLASSLVEGLTSLSLDVDATLVVLGDQPQLRAGVLRAVVGAWRGPQTPIVVPRYGGDGALNPVLLDRSMFEMALRLEGDRGMGPLIAASPDLVLRVPVPGDNPDVDTPADLARLAERTVDEETA